eukprot:1371345-Pyramimonas_sp.AAC.1
MRSVAASRRAARHGLVWGSAGSSLQNTWGISWFLGTLLRGFPWFTLGASWVALRPAWVLMRPRAVHSRL